MNKIKEINPDESINITGDTCPMTFVKTKLRLEKMEKGQILRVVLNNGEPLKNVPLSCQELGHQILDTTSYDDGKSYELLIEKGN